MFGGGQDSLGDLVSTELSEITAIVRRVVSARVQHPDTVDDIVQETLVQLLAARDRLDDRALGPYAIVVARNLVASHWRRADTGRRHEHRLLDRREPSAPDELILRREESDAVRAALERLAPEDREMLVAHEVDGEATSSLAQSVGSTAGAVAARLNRSRAKLRVEYLLELAGQPPSSRCRPVLLSLSAGDRRRQAELDAGHHLLECDYCADLGEALFERRSGSRDEDVRIPVKVDADVVTARQRGRDLALGAGFSMAEATLIATAISEIARNIVRFAHRGELTLSTVLGDESVGITIVARDAGPGIADVDEACAVGFTTYGGRGLGLPGCRRMMDEFAISSEIGRGTTVTMTKWRRL